MSKHEFRVFDDTKEGHEYVNKAIKALDLQPKIRAFLERISNQPFVVADKEAWGRLNGHIQEAETLLKEMDA